MSQENVEIVRRFYGAVTRAFEAYWKGNRRSLADEVAAGRPSTELREMLALTRPDVEWNVAFAGVTYRGHDGCSRGLDDLMEASQEYRSNLREAKDLRDDQVLAVVDVSMKGKATAQMELELVVFTVVTVIDGLIARLDERLDRAEALEAAGLSE
jgi:ketosteroid isomerase-like protein